MGDHKIIIRIMGESDIVDVEMTDGQLMHEMLVGLTDEDRLNLLGHWMDRDRGEALSGKPSYLAAMAIIASAVVAKSTAKADLADGANFVLLTLLRERWPVGTKAKFRKVAERVKADHTYLAHVCAAARLDDLANKEALKQAETTQLSLALAFYKANRGRFANSSAVQGLIRG